MIVTPMNDWEWRTLADFMKEKAYVTASIDTRYVGWVEDNTLKMCVAFNAFLGKTCQIHVAMVDGYAFTPKAMLDFCFDFAFNQLKIETLIGIVNGNNKKALRYDKHLGFVEKCRLVGMHDDGGDLVMLVMPKENCKYLVMKEAA